MPVTGSSSPAAARRQLGGELYKIRQARGESIVAVAAALGWAPSKLSRYERARVRILPGEVSRLLGYYGIPAQKMLGLAAQADQPAWWNAYESDMTPEQYQLMGLEQGATSVRIWQQDAVPGLLQTEDYARQILTSLGRVEPMWPELIGRLAQCQMLRQQILGGESPAALSVVLDEAVLLRPAGEGVLAAQLRHLVCLSASPNVRIQVLPLSSPRRLPGGSFTVLGFDSMPDIAASEALAGVTFAGTERRAYLYSVAFQVLADAALSPELSRDLILDAAAALSPPLHAALG
jgi:transcriptional regulator with XRE-family HTH domain